MSRGFLTLAQNGKYDYVKMAYVLAMSLKLSQGPETKLSVIVNKDSVIPDKYIPWFDKIIYLESPKEDWKIQNKWQYFWVTPYDETIVLDCDMLFFNDINLWWDMLTEHDLIFTTKVRNFKGEVATSNYYRDVFVKNKLPNFYTAFFYFNKTKDNENFFSLVKLIFKYWKEWYSHLLEDPPSHLSGDVAYAIAANTMFPKNWEKISDWLSFTHMRERLQNNNMVNNWAKTLNVNFSNVNNDLSLKVNNFNQQYPFHYINKNFLTKEVIDLYEENTLHLL